MGWYYEFRPYVSVAKRRANAQREMAKLAKKGRIISPVKLASKKIATTFWGKAWCENLESYSDYSNRLPRGRTYVRNGSVVDLQITPGKISAVVSGSELYDVTIKIKALAPKIWSRLKSDCGGKIGSLVELLQGRLAQGVMELVTRKKEGLFPTPGEIEMDCSCPDSAGMCKHIAAVLYGIGARLDQQPEMLFSLRQVDHLELISQAAVPAMADAANCQTIASDDLADVFGIELDNTPAAASEMAAPGDSTKQEKKATTPSAKRTTRRAKLAAPKVAKPEVVPDRKRRTKKEIPVAKTRGKRMPQRKITV